MMNMVAANNKGIGVAAVGRYRVVLCLGDLAVFEGDVPARYDANADASALKAQTSNNQERRINNIEVILLRVGVRGTSNDRPRIGGRANQYGFSRQAVELNRSSAGLRVGAFMSREFVPRV